MCVGGPCPTDPITVMVDHVSLQRVVWFGGREARQYVVPVYHFTGRTSDGSDWSRDVIALTDDALAPGLRDGASPPPIPVPAPGGSSTCHTPSEICGKSSAGSGVANSDGTATP